MEKNLFVSFEGIDGCGKDTQLHKLCEAIRDDNNYPFGNKYSNIWITREPTKITSSGIKISELLSTNSISPEDATRYFIEDRKEHSTIIKSILKHSHVLISRYDLSTLSYQMTQGMDFDELYKLHSYNSNDGCIIPDITIVFDINVDLAFERMSKRGSKKEFFEIKSFQEKLRDNLFFCIDELKKRDGRKIIVVNSNQSIDEVTKEMCEKISKTFS